MVEDKTVSIPSELAESINNLIHKTKELGYKDLPEFVKDAIRHRLEKLGKIIKSLELTPKEVKDFEVISDFL